MHGERGYDQPTEREEKIRRGLVEKGALAALGPDPSPVELEGRYRRDRCRDHICPDCREAEDADEDPENSEAGRGGDGGDRSVPDQPPENGTSGVTGGSEHGMEYPARI